jgi:hypothetical protein
VRDKQMSVAAIISDAKRSNKVFSINGKSIPTYQSRTTYYISGDNAAIHSWAYDQYEFMSIHRHIVCSTNEARAHYRQSASV